MENIHLAIIEDSSIVREGLVEGLRQDEAIASIREFTCVEDFLWQEDLEPAPNVMLLDLGLPRIKGNDAIDGILLKYPHLNILVFSMYMETSMIIDVISKGAVGYVLKSQQGIDEILDAIKIVHKGGSYLSPVIARKVINLFHPSRIAKTRATLTRREEQVLNGLMKGQTYQEIADDLIISIDTVRTYIKKIYGKMKVKNKTQLVSTVQDIYNTFRKN